jgi:nitroreductase
MKASTSPALEAIFQRRAVKVFEPVEISQALRELILDAARVAPSSFNMQPYRFYWVESPSMRESAAQLCMGQGPAKTASALVVARRRHWIMAIDHAKLFRMGAPTGLQSRESL